MEAPPQEKQEPEDMAASMLLNPSEWSIEVQSHYQTAKLCGVLDCNYLMRDLGVTTEQDQRQWLCQGVSYKDPMAPYSMPPIH
jgi:hypothetical protein